MTYPFPPLRSLPKGLLQPSQTCTHVCSLSGVWDRAHLMPPWAATAEPTCARLAHSRAFVFVSSLRQTLELLHVASSKVLGSRESVALGGGSSAALI